MPNAISRDLFLSIKNKKNEYEKIITPYIFFTFTLIFCSK